MTLTGNCGGGDSVRGTPYSYIPEKNLGPENCDSPQTHCGNPINAAIGNKYQSEVDFVVGGELGFTRHYNSHPAARSDGFGPGWTHSFSRRVEHIASPSGQAVSVLRPEGGQVNFRYLTNQWVADADVHASITRISDSSGGLLGWSFTIEDAREVEEYDALGRLIWIRWADGRAVELTYNNGLLEGNANDRRLTRVQARDGRSLVLEYDSAGRVVKVSDSAETSAVYGYDTAGRLGQVLMPGGATKYYLYNESAYTSGANLPNALTGIVDEGGQRYSIFKYASDGKASSTEHAGGANRFSVQYNANGSVKISEPSGGEQTRVFVTPLGVRKASSVVRQCPGCDTQSTAYLYDANGRPDVLTDQAGVATDYDYNARGLLTQRIDATNASSGVKRTTQTDWHSAFRVPIERRTYNATNALVAKSTWTYNARGQMVASTQYDTTTSSIRTTTTTYCEQVDVDAGRCPRVGLVTSVDGPRTDVSDITTYQYYAADHTDCDTSPTTCRWRKGDLWKVTNALGHVTETRRYDGAGRVLSVEGADGVVTDMEYHPRGWLTAHKVRGSDAASEADDQITRIDYWPTGLVSSVTLPGGSFTSYVYDAAHRLTDIVDADGNRLHYTLDNAGNRIKEEVLDEGGSVKGTLSRVYNQLGQLQAQKDAGNYATTFTYDANGNTDTVTDALSRVTDNDYDPLNRLKRTLQDVGGIEAETKFAYDANDNLTKVTDPKGLDTTYTYNGFGDQVQLSSPDTGITSFTYDSAGNRASQTDARGIATTYQYDALNRLTQVGYPTTSLNVSYTYDVTQPVCQAGETFSVGRLTLMVDGSGSTQYCHDRFGQLVRKVQTANGVALTLQYAYTTSGLLQAMTYPDGTVADYVRNTQGQVTVVGVTRPGQGREILLSQATYHPFGPIAGWVYGNGRTMQRNVDLDYRSTSILGGTGGLNLTYGFDAVGNLTHLDSGSSPAMEYRYDALGRLTQALDSPAQSVLDTYAYDETGNRTSYTDSFGTRAYAYPGNSHRLSSVAGESRTYDAAGNTLSIGTTRAFDYNDAGRMSQVRNGGVVAMEYAYNGRGEQVRKHLGASETQTLYSESGQWLGDYGVSGATSQQAIWMDDMPVGVTHAGQLYYIQPDQLGAPRQVVDPVQDIAVWRWDAKGESFGNTPPEGSGTNGNFVLQMRFPGQLSDEAAGLNQNYFRDYDSSVGRYVQSDPIGLEGGVSTYAYVQSTPFTSVDPYGLQQFVVPGPVPVRTSQAQAQAVLAYGPYYHQAKLAGINGIPEPMGSPLFDETNQIVENYAQIPKFAGLSLAGEVALAEVCLTRAGVNAIGTAFPRWGIKFDQAQKRLGPHIQYGPYWPGSRHPQWHMGPKNPNFGKENFSWWSWVRAGMPMRWK